MAVLLVDATHAAARRLDRPPAPTPWGEYANWLTDQWQCLLESDPPELDVQRFLEAHPSLLPGADGDIGPGGHHGPEYDAVITEPPLKGIARDRRPDFMWITLSTSLVTPICIEIERPGKHWFNKSGVPTGELLKRLTSSRTGKSGSPSQRTSRSSANPTFATTTITVSCCLSMY